MPAILMYNPDNYLFFKNNLFAREPLFIFLTRWLPGAVNTINCLKYVINKKHIVLTQVKTRKLYIFTLSGL